MNTDSIITVGICPSWDTICKVDGIEWGQHKKMVSQSSVCAGKAFNISRALAWLEVKSTAAGLWGQADIKQMLENTKDISDLVDIKFTVVAGQTRRNVTVVDTQAKREMHLRAQSKLADSETLKQLRADLNNIVDEKSTVVFAGALPSGQLLDECVAIITEIKQRTSNIIVDTNGQTLKKIVEKEQPLLISPNVKELSELLGEQIDDNSETIIRCTKKLCENVEMVMVSRGCKGAILITKDKAFEGKVINDKDKTTHTVGCGDYLLAGFLAGLKKGNIREALVQGIKVATARAWGWCEKMNWPTVERKIEVDVRVL